MRKQALARARSTHVSFGAFPLDLSQSFKGIVREAKHVDTGVGFEKGDEGPGDLGCCREVDEPRGLVDVGDGEGDGEGGRVQRDRGGVGDEFVDVGRFVGAGRFFNVAAARRHFKSMNGGCETLVSDQLITLTGRSPTVGYASTYVVIVSS